MEDDGLRGLTVAEVLHRHLGKKAELEDDIRWLHRLLNAQAIHQVRGGMTPEAASARIWRELDEAGRARLAAAVTPSPRRPGSTAEVEARLHRAIDALELGKP